MDIAQLGYEIDSSQARTAARDLDKMNAAAQKAEKGARSLKAASENLLRDEKGRFMTAAQAAEKYGAEIDRLRTKYNPLYAASKQYESSMSELKRALELGAISTAQFDAAQERLQQSLLTTSGAMQTMGHVSQQGAMQAGNVFAQINDIGVMMASGQNPFIIALQQGTQLNQVWADMGEKGKSLKGVVGMLGAGFSQFLNPVGLATIAIIAGGAALVQWGMSALGAAQNGKTFEENLDDIDARVTELKTSLDLLATDNYQGVIDQYGRVNDQIRENILIVGQLNANLLALQSINLDNLFSDTLGEYLKIRIDELKASFGMTYDEAQKLDYLMRSADAAQGIDEKIRLMTQVRDQVILAAGGVDKLNTKQSEFLLKVANAISKLEIAKSRLDAMSNVNVSGPISAAANEAARLARNLQAAKDIQDQLKQHEVFPLQYPETAPYAGPKGNAPLTSPRPVPAPVGVAGVDWGYSSEGGGGAGGGGSDQLRSLIESLQTQSAVTEAWYAASQEMLQNASDKELEILGGKLAAMEALENQYRQRKFEADQAASQMTYQAYAGALGAASDLLSVFSGENRAAAIAIIAIQKGLAIAQVIMNTSVAQMRALAELGPIAGMAMAAKIGVMGKIQMGLIAATGLAQAMSSGGTSGGGASSGGASTSATAATKAEPERVTRVVLQGDDWLVNMAESIMTQIYDASSNGRVIVSRG